MIHRRVFSSATAAVIVLLLASTAFGQSLGDIQASIKAKGQKWIAADTSISVLPDNEKRLRLGLIKHGPGKNDQILSVQAPTTGLPTNLTWSISYVTPVRNQGSCGSCWAFATTAALESNLLIRGIFPSGTDDDRAEQILVSCSGAGSCGGGSISYASNFIQSTGLPPEAEFPYTASDSACSNAASGWQNDALKMSSWAWVTTNTADVNAIKNALATYGPLVTTMDVYSDFYSYSQGVYEYSSGSYVGAHAIAIIGYQDDATYSGGGYFIVKNSWGTGWGMSGYFEIAYSQVNAPVYFGEYTIAYSSTQVSSTPPATPTGLSATAVSASKIGLSWTAGSSNQTGFNILRCTGICNNFAQIASVGSTATTYPDGSVAPSSTYTYAVQAYNTAGNSGYSSPSTATTPSCSYSVSPASATFSSTGGTGTVSVIAGAGCPWSATDNASWITLKGANGQGNGSFSYKVSQNKSRQRVGTITVAGQTTAVTQNSK